MAQPSVSATAAGPGPAKATTKTFENCKAQCLTKRDKSSAGRIDPRCVELCRHINDTYPCYYTTSSCSGRSYLYRGTGNKAGGSSSTTSFERYRVSHELVVDHRRYFDLSTLEADPTGGGDDKNSDEEPLAMSDDGKDVDHQGDTRQLGETLGSSDATADSSSSGSGSHRDETSEEDRHATLEAPPSSPQPPVWLRFEPFILHVACHSLSAAWHLARAARAGFKNVGVTAWNRDDAQSATSRYIVAVWGDEGLDMPLQSPDGSVNLTDLLGTEYLASLVNERHKRNWDKIRRFERAVHQLSVHDVTAADDDDFNGGEAEADAVSVPKSFDVIGDVAIVSAMLSADPEDRARIGKAILSKNRAIKIVALRTSNLLGAERAPGDQGLVVLAGPDRDPLITTHCESGVKCPVDLRNAFFTPRMAAERLRLCQQVTGSDEHVLVLFSGVGMDALQIASRTPASVTAIELNPKAVVCARKAHALLERNRSTLFPGATNRLKIIEGDVLDVVPTLQRDYYHRVVCPRPKEGVMDGDLGDGTGGETFLDVILPAMKQQGGVCHWYEFCSEPEFPECSRSRALLRRVCQRHGLDAHVLRVISVGSVAMRQQRVCVDFRIDLPHG